MKNVKPKNREKKGILFFRWISIFVIFVVLIFGIGLSSLKFTNDYTLGSDFKGEYSALVGVNDITKEKDRHNQPNGDANEAAKVLDERLNPTGMLDIRIEVAGKNYLKIEAPIDSYKDKTAFKNEIQKTGGVILMDNKYGDIQWNADNRTPLSDYFESAKSSSIIYNNKKEPTIEFSLKDNNFSDLIKGMTEGANPASREQQGQTQAPQIGIVTDVDSYYNDIRMLYQLSDEKKLIDRLEEYFSLVIEPLRKEYQTTENSVLKAILWDLFYVSVDIKNTSNDEYQKYYDSLMNGNSKYLKNAKTLEQNFDSMTFMSSTNKYVYDPNASTEDFKEQNSSGQAGRYSATVSVFDSTSSGFYYPTSAPIIDNDAGADGKSIKVDRVFKTINPVLFSIFDEKSNKPSEAITEHLRQYLLFQGGIGTSYQNGVAGIIQEDKLIVRVQSESAAKTGATIFNASGKGFSFSVSTLTIVDASVTKTQIILSLVFLSIIVLAMLIFVLILYRIMGMFTIIIALTISALTLLTTTLFGLALAPEVFIAILILIGLNIELSVLLFSQMKKNFFEKNRPLKTSFNIASKETIGICIDPLVVILMSNIALFWIGSSSIKILATIITIGTLLSIAFNILITRVLFRIIVGTNLLKNRPWLFAMNTDFIKEHNIFISYKINKIENKLKKLAENNPKNIDTSNLKNKLEKLIEKRNSINQKIEAKINSLEEKNQEKVKAKLDILRTKYEKNSHSKKPLKSRKILYKIHDYEYIIDGNKNISEDEIEYFSTEGLNSRANVKMVERKINLGSKWIALIFILLSILASLLGVFVGPNFDKSFGNSTEYTIWGNSILNFNIKFQDIVNNNEKKYSKLTIDKADVALKAMNKTNNEIGDAAKTESNMEFELKAITDFFVTIYSDSTLSNELLASDILSNHNVIASYGPTYKMDGNDLANGELNPWITLNVNTTSKKESRAIKSILKQFTLRDEKNQISVSDGFIAKELHSFAANKLLIQILISIAVAILSLVIYIFIRFKWTHYITIVLGGVMTLVMTAATIISLQIPIGIFTISSFFLVFILSMTAILITLSKGNIIIKSKNEKSLKIYFKKEIDHKVELKNKKREIKMAISLKKHELSLWKKTLGKELKLHKDEKLEKIKEIKLFAKDSWNEFKKTKHRIKEEISIESKRNNYLKEILVSLFKTTYKNMIFLISIFAIVSVLMIIAIPTLYAMMLTLTIGIICITIVNIFIVMPVWIKLEQIRIRNKLASKRFINNLVVSDEEQIVEGVND